jgi:tight adherence protein C
MEYLLLLGFGLAVVVLAIVGIKSLKEESQVVERIGTLSQSRDKKSPLLRQKALQSSFSERVLFPVAQGIFDKCQKVIPLSSKSWVRTKLIQAGYTKPNYQKVFFGIQLIATVVMFVFFMGIMTLIGNIPPNIGIMIAVGFSLAGFALPLLWLMQQAQKRQTSIQKSLPDFLDLLVISVEAGLGLDVAIQKLANLKSVRTSEYLRDELKHYIKDISLGKPRKDALLDMGERTGLEEFLVIINALVQAYEMGTGVAFTLRVQSETLRNKRMQRAEEKANKIPVKMVLPIYIFLFPTIFLAIFGPIVMIAMDAILSVMQNKNY